jgi:hypothetical protein
LEYFTTGHYFSHEQPSRNLDNRGSLSLVSTHNAAAVALYQPSNDTRARARAAVLCDTLFTLRIHSSEPSRSSSHQSLGLSYGYTAILLAAVLICTDPGCPFERDLCSCALGWIYTVAVSYSTMSDTDSDVHVDVDVECDGETLVDWRGLYGILHQKEYQEKGEPAHTFTGTRWHCERFDGTVLVLDGAKVWKQGHYALLHHGQSSVSRGCRLIDVRM